MKGIIEGGSKGGRISGEGEGGGGRWGGGGLAARTWHAHFFLMTFLLLYMYRHPFFYQHPKFKTLIFDKNCLNGWFTFLNVNPFSYFLQIIFINITQTGVYEPRNLLPTPLQTVSVKANPSDMFVRWAAVADKRSAFGGCFHRRLAVIGCCGIGTCGAYKRLHSQCQVCRSPLMPPLH